MARSKSKMKVATELPGVPVPKDDVPLKPWAAGILAVVIGGVLIALMSYVIPRLDPYEAKKQSRTEAARLYAAYEKLGETPRNAAAFIEEGKWGSVKDVRVTVSFLRSILVAVRMEKTRPGHIESQFGSNLLYAWVDRLEAVSAGKSPASGWFTPSDKDDYRKYAKMLRSLHEQALAEREAEEESPYSDIDVAHNASEIATEPYATSEASAH